MSSYASRDHSLCNRSTPPSDEKRQSAAFRGASRAFSQATPAPKPLSNTYSGTDGALAAASTVGTGGRKQEDSSAEDSPSYGQKLGAPSIERPPGSGVSGMHGNTRRSSQSREQSTSHTATCLATSKTTPLRDGLSNPRRRSYLQTVEDGVDTSIISQLLDSEVPSGDTTSLVKLYESKQNSKPSAPVKHSVRYIAKPPPKIASPAPIRPIKRSTSSATVPLRTFSFTSESEKEMARDAPKASHAGSVAAAAARLAAPSAAATAGLGASAVSSRQVPEPPSLRRRGKRLPLDGANLSTSYVRGPNSESPQTSGTNLTETVLNEAAANLQADTGIRADSPSLPIQSSSSSVVSSHQPSILASRPSLSSAKSFDRGNQSSSPLRLSRTTTRSIDSYVPKLTVDSLANAMVASSLASSRAPSPGKPPPLPPPRRHGKSYSLFHHHHSQEQISRTPSPAKGMRHTMREPKKLDEVDHKKRKGHIVRKHPNKHHEGDRKRYRNQVTERERKRYEGVWATNKGLLLESELDSKATVLNIIVRDIWSRSRLPNDVLEEVWDLVDVRGEGKLGREEFVVGLWLIDSRLKGNKLPSKVSESMWASVRRLSGVKVHHYRR